MNDIKCPNCGIVFQISEALQHEFGDKIRNEEKLKAKDEIAKARLVAQNELEKKLREEFANKNKSSLLEVEEARKKQKEAEEKLFASAKQAKENEEKIKETAVKEVSEKSRLEKLEFEKKISDMQKALEEAQRKGKQGSQQLQGEILELDLEQKLKSSFPNDEFLPVPKGVEGADIWQKIKYKGNVIGSILWETKRTKAWSNGWVSKLKDDSAKVSASESIIVSEVLPEGITNFDRKDGIWVTSYEHAVSICRYVRFLITTVSSIKSKASQTDEDWGKIRDYMMSDSFTHRMRAHYDAIGTLRESLTAEKRSAELRWRKQIVQIDKLDSNITVFYSELKAIVPNLPEVKGIDSVLLESGEDENEKDSLI